MAARLACPTCGGNFHPDPDVAEGVVCMMCGRTVTLAELRGDQPVTSQTPAALVHLSSLAT